MKKFNWPWVALALVALVAIGCGKEESTETASPNNEAATKKYVLAVEPKGSIEVIKARETMKDGDEVVIVGRVGGTVGTEGDVGVPWVKGLAAFRIVDSSLKTCTEVGSHDCASPWDYC